MNKHHVLMRRELARLSVSYESDILTPDNYCDLE